MSYPENTLPGNDANASSALAWATHLTPSDVEEGKLPAAFPIQLWSTQSQRYSAYWAWHTGEALEEVVGEDDQHQPVYRYPLKINPVRDFARKHAALLFGEYPDTPTPLVKTLIAPKTIFGKATPAQKEVGQFLSDFVTEVWTQSNGRSIQYENGEVSQFLGGSVFQVCYQPWRTDLLIPITMKNWYANYFLPVWSADSYYDLLEAWLAYRVDPVVARLQWGEDIVSDARAPAIYCEHWTRSTYSITVNGKPLKATYPNGQVIDYSSQPNPFGFVPFVYIPRIREGDYYGSSIVPDIAGTTLEFNARAADEGDAMRETVHQKYVGKNLSQKIETLPMDKHGNEYLDLGKRNPMLDADPELEALDPPVWNKSYSDHKEWLWNQLLRMAALGPIAFGEDEGSQRSALTLAFRMWPSTIIAKAQRTFWTDGLIQCAKYVLRMAVIKGIAVDSKRVPADFEKRMSIVPQWLPMIPRDREALVNEMILRLQSGSAEPEKALEAFSDYPDVLEGVQKIKEWLIFMASLEASKKAGEAGAGAKQSLVSPVASSGLKEDATE